MKLPAYIPTLLFLFLLLPQCKAQTDSIFWFAAPQVVIGNKGGVFNIPIYFRISTFGSVATIKVSEPANSSFNPISKTIPANSSYSLDLTPFINMVESKPANTILNYGLLIESTSPVTAYYDAASSICVCNPEIFTLKGKNALGTDFFIPSQNVLDNSHYYTSTPYSSFDIVATEDGTNIDITPSNDIVGHSAGTTFTITLNRGQSYSATAASQLAALHLQGSRVTSNKAIAITIKDDMLQINKGGDLAGDQIVPMNVIGKEYIVAKGFSNTEYAFILATQDNTSINIDGSYVKTINKGETYPFHISNSSDYITASQPIYILHLSGNGDEMGEALIPPITCTGSSRVSFTRSSSMPLNMILITKAGNEGSFNLNGNTTIISPSKFSAVPGTGGAWVTAAITSLSSSLVPIGSASTISNTKGKFHLGIFNGDVVGGSEYGYFSDFTALNLGSDIITCQYDSVRLDAGAGNTNYLWSDSSKNRYLTVKKSGTYYVSVSTGSCTLFDTIKVTFQSAAKLDLGKDTIVCSQNPLLLDTKIDNATYQWNDGSTSKTLSVNKAGKYWVKVSTPCGTKSDTIHVNTGIPPKATLGPDKYICKGDSVILKPLLNDSTLKLLWQDGSTKPKFVAHNTGTYWVEANSVCGKIRDSIQVNVLLKPSPTIKDTNACNSSLINYSLKQPAATYKWSTGDTSSSVKITKSGKYWGMVKNICGANTDTFKVAFIPFTPVKLPNDTFLCNGDSITMDVSRTGATYLWQDGSTNFYSIIKGPGTYWVRLHQGLCYSSDTVIISPLVAPKVNLGQDTLICAQDNMVLRINGLPPLTKISWQDNSSKSSYYIDKAGLYYVKVSNPCGYDIDSINISTWDCECKFIIPNAFTPNNDSINQTFLPLGCNVKLNEYQLSIYNRWGEMIFETYNRYQSWDGNFKNKPCEEGAYIYIIRYKDKYETAKLVKGTITLLR